MGRPQRSHRRAIASCRSRIAAALRRYGSFFDVVRLYRALARERPDIILQFVGSAHTGIAALYARRHGCKMIWRVTNDPSVEPETASWRQAAPSGSSGYSSNFGIRNATLILAQTQYQRTRLAETFPNAPVQVLPNFHPTPPDCGRNGAVVKQVAWVANLKPLKNPGAFVRLARRFAHRSDIRFVMIGDTIDDGDWTKRQLDEIAATPNLEYRGALSQAEVNGVLEHTDLLVNTSDHEGFSNTFIQAWMRRVPVVSLRVDPDRLLSGGGLGVVTRRRGHAIRARGRAARGSRPLRGDRRAGAPLCARASRGVEHRDAGAPAASRSRAHGAI